MNGFYCLHKNGDLLFKRDLDDGAEADFRESDFVRMFWRFDETDRECAWRILVEALALGAAVKSVEVLADRWGCSDADAAAYAARVGAMLVRDGNAWCATREDFANLQESPAGFGDTCLHALAELAKTLGFRAQKTWGKSFHDLLKAPL